MVLLNFMLNLALKFNLALKDGNLILFDSKGAM